MSVVDAVWYGDSVAARVGRALLLPASWLYGAEVRRRNARYDVDGDMARGATIPVLSLGNLTVGGTGKTPVAAWVASRLRSLGASPAIVMRGYGDDEPLVHARLNPDVRVVADADRVRGVASAAATGADVAILDDGFQHRRLARTADWVLVSAEQWRPDAALLPAGPLREPIDALSRADTIVVTRKSASATAARSLADELGARFPNAGVAVCHLALESVVDARSGATAPLSTLRGWRVVAVAAVGQPAAFFAQLGAQGASVNPHPYRDHHAFVEADVQALVRAAESTDGVVCTLKDAVKLAPLWPRAGPALWYVSQTAVIEWGHAVLDDAIEDVLAHRSGASPTARSADPST